MKSQKLLIIVPAIVTVVAVMIAQNSYNMRDDLAPLVYRVADHVHHLVGMVIRSVMKG